MEVKPWLWSQPHWNNWPWPRYCCCCCWKLTSCSPSRKLPPGSRFSQSPPCSKLGGSPENFSTLEGLRFLEGSRQEWGWWLSFASAAFRPRISVQIWGRDGARLGWGERWVFLVRAHLQQRTFVKWFRVEVVFHKLSIVRLVTFDCPDCLLYKRKKTTKNKSCWNIAVNILPPGVAKNRALTGQSACQYWSIYAPFNKVTKTVCRQTTFDK